jgi:hypothetical protein
MKYYPIRKLKPVNRMTRTARTICGIVALSIFLSACNFDVEEPTPTAEGIIEQDVPSVPDVEDTLTPTVTPSPSLPGTREVALLESPLPSFTPGPPTETETLTPTEGPIEHVIQDGETLSSILPQHGYFDFSVIPAVRAINPTIPDLENLQSGSVILIPRMTATPTPEGMEMTSVANATLGITPLEPNFDNVDCYTVQEGESIVTIALDFNTTIEVLRQLNPTLYFPPTCDFTNRSGGPDCSVNIQIGMCINVPYPTLTPTLSPTPNGSETATPTPPFRAPRIVAPPEGAIITGDVSLQWVSAGRLDSDEAYFIQIFDVSQPDAPPVTGVSYTNNFLLPESLTPTDGQERIYEWTVAVAQRNEQGSYRIIGGESPRRQFKIPSR